MRSVGLINIPAPEWESPTATPIQVRGPMGNVENSGNFIYSKDRTGSWVHTSIDNQITDIIDARSWEAYDKVEGK